MIAELRERGFALSIDTMDPDEILMADEAGVDYVLSLNGSNRDLAERLRATPVLIPDTPEDLDSLETTIAHLERLGKPYLVDPIVEPIGTGFAASLGRYLEVRRRHPEAEMLMGIGNLTELTEADSTGVTAVLIGFCQELGIRNVLTTEVINWAHGAVQEAVLAAQLMHFAHEQGTPPKHVDGRLLTVKDEDLRPYAESELRELHAQVTDPNFRIFADSDWIYVFNAELFVKGTDFNEIFDQLGVDEPTHAFYLGKELMKATIARALGKNYRQESPLDWGYMTFEEPRRKRVGGPGDNAAEKVVASDRQKPTHRGRARGDSRRASEQAEWRNARSSTRARDRRRGGGGIRRHDDCHRADPGGRARIRARGPSPAAWGCARAHAHQRRQEHPLRGLCRAMATPSSSGW